MPPAYCPVSLVASVPSKTRRDDLVSRRYTSTRTLAHGSPSARTSPPTCSGSPRCASASVTFTVTTDGGRSSFASPGPCPTPAVALGDTPGAPRLDPPGAVPSALPPVAAAEGLDPLVPAPLLVELPVPLPLPLPG